MLTQEGKLLQMVQNGVTDEEELDAYAVTLAEFLDRKTLLIHKLQGKLAEFKLQLAKEQELAQRVKHLSQY
jgi:aminoglycoside phosphotransferase family enzyme